MKNTNYLRGRAREYRIKSKYEKRGFIVLRTAQSRGFADLIAIHPKEGAVIFIQSKPKSMSNAAKKRIEKEFDWISGKFECSFEVRS